METFAMSLEERERQAIAHFMKRGWTLPQAAGIVGNLIQESSLNTGARNKGDGRDGSDSIGVLQANGDRARALMRFAAQRGVPWTDFATQLDYVDHELNTTERAAGNRLRAAQDVARATEAVIGFERPAGWSLANPRGGHGWDNRLGHASRLAGLPAPAAQEVAPDRSTFQAMARNTMPSGPEMRIEPSPSSQDGPMRIADTMQAVNAIQAPERDILAVGPQDAPTAAEGPRVPFWQAIGQGSQRPVEDFTKLAAAQDTRSKLQQMATPVVAPDLARESRRKVGDLERSILSQMLMT